MQPTVTRPALHAAQGPAVLRIGAPAQARVVRACDDVAAPARARHRPWAARSSVPCGGGRQGNSILRLTAQRGGRGVSPARLEVAAGVGVSGRGFSSVQRKGGGARLAPATCATEEGTVSCGPRGGECGGDDASLT
jgi:hypothetical protein